MKRIFQLCFLALLVLGFASGAYAQATRTWVSGVGDDANPCSRTAPCKTFAGAISKTAAGGEISVLDPGGFGALTITKAITLDGGGNLASLLVSGTNGITIVAGPTDVVTLRNLSFAGIGSGLAGVEFQSGAALNVEHCVIEGFTTNDIEVNLSAPGQVMVEDTTMTGGADGVKVDGSSPAFVTLKNVTIQGAGNAIEATSGTVIANHSVISGSTSFGALADGGTIDLEDSMFNFNGTAVQASTGSAVRISNDDLFSNTVGIGSGGGTINSAGNNRKIGNTTAGAPNGTIAVQ